jgi:NAD(P)-dependent dehydrogenase (short-subunit alcohol dehydrogenase family)
MKILIIGGTGTIGRRLTERLVRSHAVIIAGKNSGDIRVNMEQPSSIRQMFDSIGHLDSVVSAIGSARWDKFENLSEDDYYNAIRSKLMGQVNLVRIGKDYITDGGSITLTTGILGDEPQPGTTAAAMVNGAIHSFVKAVSLELKTIRVNVVCPDVVEDSWEKLKDYFPGHVPVPMAKVVDGYLKSIEGEITGEIIRINM